VFPFNSLNSPLTFREDPSFFTVEKAAISDPNLLGKRQVRIIGQNRFGASSTSFIVKIAVSCEIASFTPDLTDMVDPVNRMAKSYEYKIGDPMLKVNFKEFITDKNCG
jgi:hypothetical protein